VNCRVEIGDLSCLDGDIEGVRAGVEDRLATSDGIVLGAGVIFLFLHKKVELLLSSPLVFVFVKNISSALPLSLYLASESYSPFFLSTSGLGGCGVGIVRVDTIMFRAAVFLLLSSSTIHLGYTALLTATAIVLRICNYFYMVRRVHFAMLVLFWVNVPESSSSYSSLNLVKFREMSSSFLLLLKSSSLLFSVNKVSFFT
jgi:hypothetical protein